MARFRAVVTADAAPSAAPSAAPLEALPSEALPLEAWYGEPAGTISGDVEQYVFFAKCLRGVVNGHDWGLNGMK